jgi:glucose dehydrogenase
MKLTSVFCVVVLPLFFSSTFAAVVNDQDWPVYGGSAANTHYSKLSQINRDNVAQLQIAWSFDTGDAFTGSEMQCNPLIVDGVMYIVSPKADVIALNAANGAQLWRFSPLAGQRSGKMRTRGLTFWTDGKERRIFSSARQYLFAIDATTGKPVESFGENGRIDMRNDLGRDKKDMVALSSPGIVYRDLLIIAPANCVGRSTQFRIRANSATRRGLKMRGNKAAVQITGLEWRSMKNVPWCSYRPVRLLMIFTAPIASAIICLRILCWHSMQIPVSVCGIFKP